MKSKFLRLLQQFLEQESISVDCGIVNDITYRLAGITFDEKSLSTGFSFRTNYSYYNHHKDSDNDETQQKEDEIYFSLSGMNLEQLNHIFVLFGIKPETYKVNNPLTLDNSWLLNKFLPDFISQFRLMKASEPQVIAQYKIASAPILESSAKNTILTYTSAAKNILIAEPLKTLPDSYKKLFNDLSVLVSCLQCIPENPQLYENLEDTAHCIDERIRNHTQIQSNIALISKLMMIQEGIQLYVKYNRNESILSLMQFMKEFKTFLADYSISAEVEGCNILEDVVLDLAGAKQNSASTCRFAIGSDPSRFTIRYEDISKENANKIIDYLLHLGDETVCEGYGSQRYGSLMAESYGCTPHVQCAMGMSVAPKRIETHSIEMDGNFFFEKVFPLIQDKIIHMTKQKLAMYQAISKVKFPDMLPKVTPLSLFQAENGTNPETEVIMHKDKRLHV